MLEVPGRLKGEAKTYQRHIWTISLNKTDSLAGSDFIWSFPISMSCILDASSTQDVSMGVSTQLKEGQTVDSVAALPESVYLLGTKGVVVF